MKRLEMKNCNAKLTEKPQKFEPYRQVKLINILQKNKYYLPIEKQIIQQAKFTYLALRNALKNQAKKKKKKLKQLKGMEDNYLNMHIHGSYST